MKKCCLSNFERMNILTQVISHFFLKLQTKETISKEDCFLLDVYLKEIQRVLRSQYFQVHSLEIDEGMKKCCLSNFERMRILTQVISRCFLKLQTKETVSREDCVFLTVYLKGIQRVLRSQYFPAHSLEIYEGLCQSHSKGQFESKMWLLQVLKQKGLQNMGVVFLAAGWYGVLAFLLLKDSYFNIKNVFLFEKDPLSVLVSEDLNRYFVMQNWKFKSTLKNILDISYIKDTFETLKATKEPEILQSTPDTIINTSCEHIENFPKWWSQIPPKKLVILQSNNYKGITDHINCVSSIKEFKKMASMDNLIYEGQLDLKKYKRFMLIGYKT